MRRSFAVLAVLAAVLSLTAVPAAAMPHLVLDEVRTLSPGATTKIELSARSDTDLTRVRAAIKPLSGEPVSIPVDDFELVEGTAQDGVWRTKSAVTVEPGRWWVDVELTNTYRTLMFHSQAVIDNGVDTVLTEVEITPTTIDVENPQVTFRGRLQYRTADGTMAPLVDAPLHLTRSNGGTATAVTGADGRAEGTIDFVRSADAVLSYKGDFTYQPAESPATRITKQRLKTRITLNMPDRLIVGDQVTVSGQLERQSRDGVWAPLAGKELDLQFNKSTESVWHTIATPTTDANGHYSVPVVISTHGVWVVDFANDPVNLPEDYYGYASSYAGTDVRHVVYRTGIVNANAAPEPVGLGSTVTVSGTVMRKMADGQWTPAPALGNVVLQFSTDETTWTNKDVQVMGGDGKFKFQVPAERDGYWRAMVTRNGHAEPSTGWADYVDVKYRTHIHSYNASPEPVTKGAYITVKGLLYRYMPQGIPGPGANVHVYFKPNGSSKWTWMGAAKTASNGWFNKKFKASQDGTWLGRYWGNGTYLGSNLPTDYVDVR